ALDPLEQERQEAPQQIGPDPGDEAAARRPLRGRLRCCADRRQASSPPAGAGLWQRLLSGDGQPCHGDRRSAMADLDAGQPIGPASVDLSPEEQRRAAMKTSVTWILLADGAQAKVFEHSGPGTGLTAVRDFQLDEEPLMAREIM